jgi:CRISPR/Cas system-associated protein endoribonuclease Cas2
MSRILFSLLLSLSYNCLQANIRDLLLSDKQYDSVIFLVNNAKLNESVEVELRKIKKMTLH